VRAVRGTRVRFARRANYVRAMRLLPALLLLAACGPQVTPGNGDDDPTTPDARGPSVDAGPGCPPPPNPAGPDVEIAPQYHDAYTAYDLGTVPGVPNPLGGAAVLEADHDVLMIAGGSESADGGIYRIGLARNACGHIVGFVGAAQRIADTPYVDANLVYAHPDLLAYTEWPEFGLSQIAGGANVPTRRTDLRTVGMDATDDEGPGGLGFVPPGLGAAGQLRLVTWPAGRWYHVDAAEDGTMLAVNAVHQQVQIDNNPGGFAYVPAGSPGFDHQAIIVAEWRTDDQTQDRVAVYDADDSGDPVPTTRREFFSKFPRPWGAYFEPVTGDYLFLSWGTGADHVYVVEGFVPPPIIQ
jgi:hypothetical protein